MPELTAMHFGLLALMLVIGVVLGWIFRSDRCAKEKIAVNASWQEQLESQQSEHNRLAEQNKSLMEQISQYQASQKDYSNRAKELSESLKEAFSRRDELQRQLKDMRGNLEVAAAQRDRLRNDLKGKTPQGLDAALREKDDKIFQLSRELTSWQSRVPPLVERFQQRDKEARELAEQLEKTEKRLVAIEGIMKSDQTWIEPVDADALPAGGDASNEPIAMTSAHDASTIQDQIDHLTEAGPTTDIVSVDEFVEPVGDDDNVVEDEDFEAVFSEDRSDPVEIASIADSADRIAAVADDDDQGDDQATDITAETDLAVNDVADDDEAEDTSAADAADTDDAGDDDVEIASAAPETDEDEADDLQQIKGIGPSIEKTLNGLGVYRFHQIAEMSEVDIDRVAQHLRGFRSRIYREDWIGQARDLQQQNAGKLS